MYSNVIAVGVAEEYKKNLLHTKALNPGKLFGYTVIVSGCLSEILERVRHDGNKLTILIHPQHPPL